MEKTEKIRLALLSILEDQHLSIKALRESEASIKESEKRLKSFVDNLPAGAVYVEGDKILVNKGVEVITQYSRFDFRNIDDWFTNLFGEDASYHKSIYYADKLKFFKSTRNFSIKQKYGDERIISFSGYLSKNNEVWLINDITEQYLAEFQYTNVIETVKDPFFNMNKSGKIFEVNDAASQILGYEKNELTNMNFADLCVEEDRENVNRALQDINIFNNYLTTKFQSKTKVVYDVELSLNYTEIGGGKIVAFARDMTERLTEQRILKESEERYRNLINGSPDGVAIHRNGKILYVNPAGLKILNAKNSSDVIGKNISKFVHPDNMDDALDRINRLIKGEKDLYPAEARYVRLDGSTVPVEIISVVIKYDGYDSIQTVVRDITERKFIEQEKDKLNEELERRVKLRTSQLEESISEMESFTYTVSHDLRTPLRAINGFSNMLVQGYGDSFDDEAKRLVNIIETNTVKMDNLITDLLRLSRLSLRGLNKRNLNMKELAVSVFHELTLDNDVDDIEFKVEEIPNASADAALIHQVWTNLISNALKYSKSKNKIKIVISGKELDDKNIYSISDNGVGFNQKYSDKLFGIFQRLHKESDFPGTGVGLAIVHRIIKRNGGKVWGESPEDEGAKFSFTLPKVG